MPTLLCPLCCAHSAVPTLLCYGNGDTHCSHTYHTYHGYACQQVLNAVRYAHRVLGVRPNVTVLDQNYMQFEWFVTRAKRQPYFAALSFPGAGYGTRHGDGFVMLDLLEANYKTHSIYVAGGIVPADRSWEGAYRMWPLGLAAQMLRRDAAIKIDRSARCPSAPQPLSPSAPQPLSPS